MWKKRAIFFGFLISFTAFWFIFSGIFNIIFVIFCLVSLIISFYLDRHFFFDKNECIIFPSFSFVKYLVVIVQDIASSSFFVLTVMLKSKGKMPEPKIKNMSFKIKNPHVRAFIENSITVTPATYVINSDENMMIVSAVNEDVMKDLVSRKFISKIYSIFRKFNFEN